METMRHFHSVSSSLPHSHVTVRCSSSILRRCSALNGPVFAHCPYTLPFNHGKANYHKQSASLTKNSPTSQLSHFISSFHLLPDYLAPAHFSPDFTLPMAIILKHFHTDESKHMLDSGW